MNLGLRRAGLLLLEIGALVGIAGTMVGSLHPTNPVSQVGIRPIFSGGFWAAIIGIVLVTLSHREWGSGTGPTPVGD